MMSKAICLSLLLALCSYSYDPRYRTYEFFNHQVGSNYLHFRVGANGYVPGSDFITVGQLDGNSVGPYSSSAYQTTDAQGNSHSNDAKVFGEFSNLESCEKKIRPTTSMNIEIQTGNISVGCKENILAQQITVECNRRPDGTCQSIVDDVDGWVANGMSGPPVFEIANEPNVYPYMTPETYAWYYAQWVDEIKKVRGDAIILNGGIFCFQGLPRFIRTNLSFAGINQNPDINSEIDYFKNFIAYLKLLKPTNWAEYRPDILNLHFYPYIDIMADNDPFFSAGGYGGNTGFIPWTLMPRFVALNSMIGEGNKFTKRQEVWLTELGNINPIPETHARILMSSIFNALEGVDDLKSSHPLFSRITRWYYFMASGNDPKYDAITKYDRYIKQFSMLMSSYKDGAQWNPLVGVLGVAITEIASYISGQKIPSLSMLADAAELGSKISTQGVSQGLEYSANHNISLLGAEFMARADKSYFPPQASQSEIQPLSECSQWMPKCEASLLFGWTFSPVQCSAFDIAIPCKNQDIGPFVNLLLRD